MSPARAGRRPHAGRTGRLLVRVAPAFARLELAREESELASPGSCTTSSGRCSPASSWSSCGSSTSSVGAIRSRGYSGQQTAVANRADEVSIQSVRQISSDLRPAVLDHLGLKDAIQWRRPSSRHARVSGADLAWEVDDGLADSNAATRAFSASCGSPDQRRSPRARRCGSHHRARPSRGIDAYGQGQRKRITKAELSSVESIGLLGMSDARDSWRPGDHYRRPWARNDRHRTSAREYEPMKRILLVDDHPVVRQGIKQGYQARSIRRWWEKRRPRKKASRRFAAPTGTSSFST